MNELNMREDRAASSTLRALAAVSINLGGTQVVVGGIIVRQ